MKKNVIFFIAAFFFSFNLAAQEESCKKWEDMKAKKMAYITEKVQLTPEEAQLFWPVYNEMDKKIAMARHKRHEAQKNMPKDPTVADYMKINDLIMNSKQEVSALKMEYYQKFKKILSPEKIYRYYQSESDYKKVLLKSIEVK